MPTPGDYVETTIPQVVPPFKRGLTPQEMPIPERMPTPQVVPPFQRVPTPEVMPPLQREPAPLIESASQVEPSSKDEPDQLDPGEWLKAEDDLLRSLVHMSRGGDDHEDPPLGWRDISLKMKEYVARNGALSPLKRVYTRLKVKRRWMLISPDNTEKERRLPKQQ